VAKSAMTQLQEQIEAIRREGFAAGYAAAMQAVREVASKPAPGAAAPRAVAPVRTRREAAPLASPRQARQPRGRRRAVTPATPPARRGGRAPTRG
jgi:hypothetical protein